MEENIRTYIIDASFVLAYLFPSEKTKKVDEIFEKCRDGEITLLSIQLLPFEVLNSIKWSIVTKRHTPKEAEKMVKGFFSLDISYEEIDFQEVYKLALEENLTIYDASYLKLAINANCKLLTFDKQLKNLN